MRAELRAEASKLYDEKPTKYRDSKKTLLHGVLSKIDVVKTEAKGK